MTYRPLNERTIVDYLAQRPEVAKVFSDFGHLSVSEVGDGNLNLVFIVRNEDNPAESVVLKQALPFLRVAGESWPLTRERMRYEVQALLKHNELAPGLVPAVYDHDDEMSVVVMEHLKTHEIMRKSLVARMRFPHFVDHITTFLVNSLFFTSDLYLTGPEKKLLAAKFVNEQLRKLQEDFVYTNPYKESPENHWNPLVDDEVQGGARQRAAEDGTGGDEASLHDPRRGAHPRRPAHGVHHAQRRRHPCDRSRVRILWSDGL